MRVFNVQDAAAEKMILDMECKRDDLLAQANEAVDRGDYMQAKQLFLSARSFAIYSGNSLVVRIMNDINDLATSRMINGKVAEMDALIRP